MRDLRARVAAGGVPAEEIVAALDELEAAIEEGARRLRAIEHSLRMLDVHVRGIEDSRIFRVLRRLGGPLIEWQRRIAPVRSDPAYPAWFGRRQAIWSQVGELRRTPPMSVMLTARNARFEWLEQAVDSVIHQAYGCWELCVRCEDQRVRAYFDGLTRTEPRIRIGDYEIARGEYIVFLGQHDLLSPAALLKIAEAVQDEGADIVYTDEDCLDGEGRHTAPLFKPDWSPELLNSCMYLGGLIAFSRVAIERAGGLRGEFSPAEFQDLALRVTKESQRVRHVPAVLYHRRGNGSDPAAVAPGSDRVRLESGEPLVSIVICSRSAKLLERCLCGLEQQTDYPRREVVIVEHLTGKPAGMERVLSRRMLKRVRYEGVFDFSLMSNLGAEAATGEILVFLNDDVRPLASSWLTKLVAQAQRPQVGVVGARLLYPSGSLQHGGIAIGIGDGCGHPGRGTFECANWKWLNTTRDVSAVTGACLAIRRELFEELGGFDQRFPVNYNDADLCLRAAEAGYRVIYEAGAVLRHDECQSRPGRVTYSERQRWFERWGDLIERGDPFYSPNLTRVREDASLRDYE